MRISIFCFLLCMVPPAAGADLYIYSASSIAPALEAIVKNYPHDKIYIVPGASSALARQINRGAKADIFISAHERWIDDIKAREIALLASNRLVMAAHPRAAIEARSLAQALRGLAASGERLALASANVPLGFYSRQALSHYQLWQSARAIAVFGESAAASLAWVARGDVAAGIIYRSDLQHYPQLHVITRFAQESHAPIRYQMARLSDGAAARALWRFLKNRQSALQGAGFAR